MSRSAVYRIAVCLLWVGWAGLLPSAARALDRAEQGLPSATAESTPSTRLQLPACLAVDYSRLELELFDDLQDGQLDRHQLLTAALIAGGISDMTVLHRYEVMFEQFIARRVAERCADLPPHQRAELLLETLHAELLTGGYDRRCTDLAASLNEGRFNCVSATILWQCLAERFELRSTAVELPGHMNARLTLANRVLAIETTCPHWFSLAGDRAARRQVLEHLSSLPDDGPAAARPLDTAGVVAAIYYNRGIDLLEASHYAEAVSANAKAHRLDPVSPTARGNLLAALNNWALWLAARQEHARACQLLAAARGMAPQHVPFQVNYVAVNQQWIDALTAAGQLAKARELADRLASELPVEPFFRRIRDEIDRQSGKS